ncbi:MAG: Enolase, partial [uncultured Gemmatimonadaceae bacterium]
ANDPRHHRARDPRQPRQPHRRSRRHAGFGRRGAGGGAERRLHGRARGARAARRRRQAVPGEGRAARGAEHRGDDPPRAERDGRHQPDRDRPRAARPRRHAEQGEAGRQRDPGGVDGHGARGGGRGGAPALPVPGGPARAHAARADDEHPQRRRARHQHGGLPGVHDRAGGRRDVRRRAPHGGGGVPRAQEGAGGAQARHRRGRRGRLRPRPQDRRGRAQARRGGDRGGRLRAGHRDRHRAGLRGERAAQGRQVHLQEERRRHARRGRDDRALREVDGAVPDRLDRGRAGGGRLGRVGAAHQVVRRPRAARGRRPVRDEHRAAGARDRERGGERDPHQGESDRHAHRDARGDRDGARRRLPQRDLAPLGRDRGHLHRRPRRGHRRRADQDRLGEPHRPGGQVQPAPPHRGAARRVRGVPGRADLRAEV